MQARIRRNDAERRKIEELCQMYVLHPDMRDVFVEGPEDVFFVKWFLDRSERDNTIIYEIQTVEIASTTVRSLGLPDNNRSRVIALASELENRLGINSSQASFIIDRDFDDLLATAFQCTLLFSTDYSCMEMYLFNQEVVGKLTSIYTLGFNYSADALLTQLAGPLQELFLIRAANEKMSLRLKKIGISGCCHISNGNLTFDASLFVTRYLNSNSKLALKSSFLSTVDSLRPMLSADRRMQIQGHDFVDMLSVYLRKNGVENKLCEREVLNRVLPTCAEYAQLALEPLFATLLQRTQ